MIETNPTYCTLLSAIEADPDNAALKLVMSEFCSDQGEDDLAFAYRWCAVNGKWPESRKDSHDWYVRNKSWFPGKPERTLLPNYIFDSLFEHPQYYLSQHYLLSTRDTCHESISDLSRVLKEQNAKLENHSQPQKTT